VDVDCFGKTAETVGQYLKKGRPILVEGRLRLDQWDDKQTGQKRSRLMVVLEGFTFLGGGQNRNAEGAAPAAPSAPAPARPAATAPAAPPAPADAPPPEEDDVPF
jgi:single-strand DNA-binding protein